MNTELSVGIDVGGTTIKAVVVDTSSNTVRIVDEVRRATPAPDPTGGRVVEAVAEITAELDIAPRTGLGVVVPGVVDETRGIARLSMNLGWREIPLASMLRSALGRGIGFGHDVRAGALAEARWGAATSPSPVVAFVPIGTGIAAALLIDGRPLVAGGWAGEIGQVIISTGVHAGARVEDIASAAATARRAGAADAKEVVERVRAGDPEALAVWSETVGVLADALATLTVAAAPGTIVVGGGLALAGDVLFDPLGRELAARLGPVPVPVLRTAALGDRAAALGAALLAARSS